ncbi:hypothetical protein F2Q65_18290 [Thiohalocapsa marina]|uniref:HD-GYP domain-containing protein n=1 Tax=Thiohalocapsa marina TaxID=424902 RepID=A0A5M8FE96_9GAMM|nr:HD domain-containing phosphohydrolase [Thiohalocapsa marina]KAA6182230.1 hypothetical protein F2Q65_18290 [Thiohalocapsa marina]
MEMENLQAIGANIGLLLFAATFVATYIPISARLMAVADVFDALVCARVYKDEYDFDQVYRSIIEAAGSHFDPVVLQAFTHCSGDFKAVAGRFKG